MAALRIVTATDVLLGCENVADVLTLRKYWTYLSPAKDVIIKHDCSMSGQRMKLMQF